MQIDKAKLKKFWGYYTLGIACIICALIYFFDVGNDKKMNDFAQLEVHLAKPIEYRKGYKGSSPYVIIKIKEYPLFQFSKNQREIKYLHEFKKNIFTGDATKQGDSISLTIYEKDAKFIREKDITKYNTRKQKYGK